MNATRAFAWFGSVAVAATLTGAAAVPAAAVQPDPVTIDVFVPDAVVPTDGTGATSLTITPSQATTLEDLRFIFELSGLAGVATAAPDSGLTDCTTSGSQLVCEEGFPQDVDEHGLSLFDIELAADPAAAAGATGVLEVTVEAAGIGAASYESAVTIGAPVDLVGESIPSLTASPGDSLSLPWTVSNRGPEPAEGAALRVHLGAFTVEALVSPSNCSIFDDDPGGMLCTFDAILEPGQTYALATPMEVGIGTDTQAPGFLAIEGNWSTLADADAWQGWRDRDGLTSATGTGPELTLIEVGGGDPAPAPADPLPAADTDPDNNWSAAEVTVEGDNRADFAAIGAELDGDAGDTVAVEVGVENLGPATADHSRSGESVNWVRVTVPTGTTAVEVPAGCWEHNEGVYLCSTGWLLRAGESELFQFLLRIDEVIADATGLVEVNRSPADPEGAPWPDPDPDNDTAKIVANSTGGAGGGLPVTGASTALVAGAGALLVALGGAGVLLFRRRRVRFQA